MLNREKYLKKCFKINICQFSAQSHTAFPGLYLNFKNMSVNKYSQNINCVHGIHDEFIWLFVSMDTFLLLCANI